MTALTTAEPVPSPPARARAAARGGLPAVRAAPGGGRRPGGESAVTVLDAAAAPGPAATTDAGAPLSPPTPLAAGLPPRLAQLEPDPVPPQAAGAFHQASLAYRRQGAQPRMPHPGPQAVKLTA